MEAAHKVSGWGKSTGHNRAQVLYCLAENLSARAADFEDRLAAFGIAAPAAWADVERSVRRCFWFATQADKFDGAVHQTKAEHVMLAVPEPLGSSASPVPWLSHCWAS